MYGKSPSICPFLKNNGDEAPKGPSPISFQELTDTRTFSNLKYTSTKLYCILIDMERFLFAHGDKNVLCLHIVYSTVHSREIMDSLIMAKYCRCILRSHTAFYRSAVASLMAWLKYVRQ